MKDGKDIKLLELSYVSGENIKSNNHFRKQNDNIKFNIILNYVSVWLSNSIPQHLSKINEKGCPYKHFFMNVHTSLIPNGLPLQTGDLSIMQRMNKQIIVYSYDGLLLSNNIDTTKWIKLKNILPMKVCCKIPWKSRRDKT